MSRLQIKFSYQNHDTRTIAWRQLRLQPQLHVEFSHHVFIVRISSKHSFLSFFLVFTFTEIQANLPRRRFSATGSLNEIKSPTTPGENEIDHERLDNERKALQFESILITI